MQPERVSAFVAIGRGLRHRCARCGASGILRDRFHLREHCPRCGYRFVREAGAFTGVMLLNLVATLGPLFLVLIAYALVRGSGRAVSIWPFALGCLAIAVVVPIVFYATASSTWAAIDLVSRPLDPDEELEALDHQPPDN